MYLNYTQNVPQVNDGVGLEGWVEAAPGEWVHVAVGNERMLQAHLPFMSASGHLDKSGKPVRGSSKVPVHKEAEKRVVDFHARWASNTVVYVSVDDELAMCMALGGACVRSCLVKRSHWFPWFAKCLCFLIIPLDA